MLIRASMLFTNNLRMGRYLQSLLVMMKRKESLSLKRLLIVPMSIAALPLLVMRVALARIVALIVIFGLKTVKLLQLGDAWQISDYLLKESEQAVWKWLRLMTLKQILHPYAYAPKNKRNF